MGTTLSIRLILAKAIGTQPAALSTPASARRLQPAGPAAVQDRCPGTGQDECGGKEQGKLGLPCYDDASRGCSGGPGGDF
jgi:hypothetical protein